MKRLRVLAGIVLISAWSSFAQDRADNNVVLRAMSDEMERSLAELQLESLDKPYFVQYTVIDEEEFSGSATFGALTDSSDFRQRVVHAQVRVGSYEFDNSEFVAVSQQPFTGILMQAVMDDDYNALRRTLWLATDAAYKQSVEILARKRAYVENKVQEEQLPDFSREAATRAVAEKRTLEFDKGRVEEQLREWSRIFREFPDIQTSHVSFRARLAHRYIVNTEGTRTMQPELVITVEARATAQAADGMQLAHSVPFYARNFEDLPEPEVIAGAIRQAAADLSSVRSAPVLDANYAGPVLLVGQASAEMFARVLAPHLSGQRGPMSERPIQNAGSALVDRLNRPVLPAEISVVDDPHQRRFGDWSLIGHYQIDDQGVPAQRVSLIEDGLLMDLLMSRRPSKDRPQSNGHGRSGYPGRESAQIGNLLVTAREGLNYEQLKSELIELCKSERLQYGIIIKSLDPNGRGSLGSPVLTYKVHVADGREELVRGAIPSGLSVQSLRHIRAVGDDTFVANRLTGTRGAETPISIVAPSVLLEELELNRPSGAQQKPALMTHPFFVN